jgi:beta-glucosidase
VGPWLSQIVAGHDLCTLLLDPDEGRMLRAIPVRRLARMLGTGLDEATVEEALNRFGITSPG